MSRAIGMAHDGKSMIPIHELLSRIRWDKDFGQGRFELGYLDRHEPTLQRVRLQDVVFSRDAPHAFEVVDESGQSRTIPLHRVREVIKDGQIIWRRPPVP